MFLRDFQCEFCGNTFESLVDSSAVQQTGCPECGKTACSTPSAPRVGVYNDPNRRAAELKRRSHNHTIREMKKEPEKHGFKADDRRHWNIRKPAAS